MRLLRPFDSAALPWDDPSVELLGAEQRAQLADYWLGRAQAELNVARAFIVLAADLAEIGSASEVLELLQISIENEREHSDLCWKLACRYAGHSLPRPDMPPGIEFPQLTSAPAELRPTLHAIGLCCINESIATVWLDHCLSHASAPLVCAATRRHVSDEVVHARVGWAHLASTHVSAAARKQIAQFVLPLLRANVGQWLDPASAGLTAEIPEHGLPPLSEHQGLVLGVVRDVVLPGFAHVGIDASAARHWLREQFG